MNGARELWKDEFEKREFSFEGHRAIVVFPKEKNAENAWVLKIEYFEAFQDLELALVRRGCHLAFLQCPSRWGTPEDTALRKRFIDSIVSEYALAPRCIPVGMSAGGVGAVRLAAQYPQAVSAVYLDAPVVNALSCPFGMGVGTAVNAPAKDEWLSAYRTTLPELISYRAHPLDLLPALICARIPVALVCGDADASVPFSENGYHIRKAYQESGVPFLFEMKEGCGHHPHGPRDIPRAVDFLLDGART